MFMGGDVHGDWKIKIFHGMPCYDLTMINCGKVQEGSHQGVQWMLPQLKGIKETGVAFIINKMVQVCVRKVGEFKRSDIQFLQTI